MKNIISVNNKLIMQKIFERSHSLTVFFSKYITNIMFENTNMSVPKNMPYVWSVMSVIFINIPTQIICCMRCLSISFDSIH